MLVSHVSTGLMKRHTGTVDVCKPRRRSKDCSGKNLKSNSEQPPYMHYTQISKRNAPE
jgi:hypothetical protein